MKSIRIGGFVLLAVGALGAFFGLASTDGVFSRIPTLVLIGVLALIWHFLTLRVFNRETMEIITEEIITEVNLPRPDGTMPAPPPYSTSGYTTSQHPAPQDSTIAPDPSPQHPTPRKMARRPSPVDSPATRPLDAAPIERFQIPHNGRPRPAESASMPDDATQPEIDLRDEDAWIQWARDLFGRPDPR